MKNSMVIFFYPSHNVGGVQTLFIRMIKRLHSSGAKVGYIDFYDGTLRKELERFANINFIDVRNCDDIGAEDVVVSSFNFLNLIQVFLPKNTRFLFWFLSPYNLPILNFRLD